MQSDISVSGEHAASISSEELRVLKVEAVQRRSLISFRNVINVQDQTSHSELNMFSIYDHPTKLDTTFHSETKNKKEVNVENLINDPVLSRKS